MHMLRSLVLDSIALEKKEEYINLLITAINI